MELLTRTFVLGLGGQGKDEIERFIATNIGKDLSLIHSLSAVSLNPTTTQVTLTYLKAPAKSVQTTSPIIGYLGATSGEAPNTVYFQYSSPVSEQSIDKGDILFDGISIDTGDYHLASGSSDYILSVAVFPYNSSGDGLHTLLVDESIQNKRGDPQLNSTLFGYTLTPNAAPNIGEERLYSLHDIRGDVELKYAVLDSTSPSNQKIKEMLRPSEELIAFATVQKTTNTTEFFFLVVSRPEPRVVSTFPRMGASNPTTSPFDTITLTFAEDIDINQATTVNGTFLIHATYNSILGIPAARVTNLDSRTIQIDVANTLTDINVSTNYVTIFIPPGLKSAIGVPTTKGYMYGFVSSAFLSGGATGAQGPPGEPGESGAIGATGPSGAAGAPGESGAIGASGSRGQSGSRGVSGSSGPSGAAGPQGDAGATGESGAIGATGPQGEAGPQGDPGPQGPQGPTGEHTGALGDIQDVDLTFLSDQDVLKWQDATQTWDARSVGQLGELDNVSEAGKQVGDGPAGIPAYKLIVYNGTNWVSSGIYLDDLLDVVAHDATTGDFIAYDGTGQWRARSNPVKLRIGEWNAFSSTGDDSGVSRIIPLSTEVTNINNVGSITGGYELTVNYAGYYSVLTNFSIHTLAGGANTAKAFTEINTGDGFKALSGSEVYLYMGAPPQSRSSTSRSMIRFVEDGDKFRLGLSRHNGSDTVYNMSGLCGLTLQYLSSP
jgi:hypothetical protein